MRGGLGTITNGDFRRWYLAGKDLSETIEGLYNKRPVKFTEDYSMEEVKKMMVTNRLEAVPVVDNEQNFVDALFCHGVLLG